MGGKICRGIAVLIWFILLSRQGVIKTEENINERISTLEANERNIFHQLDEIKNDVRDIRRLTAAVEKVALQTENTAKKVYSIDKRLEYVERAPAEDMKYYKRAIIGCIATGIIGIILGAVATIILK